MVDICGPGVCGNIKEGQNQGKSFHVGEDSKKTLIPDGNAENLYFGIVISILWDSVFGRMISEICKRLYYKRL